MPDREKVIKGINCCLAGGLVMCKECPYMDKASKSCNGTDGVLKDALELLKDQEPRELTKEEWEQWKKDERRDPICMVWYGDTTPFWVLKPESVNELLYLMGKIKLFTKKPSKEQVKWDAAIQEA